MLLSDVLFVVVIVILLLIPILELALFISSLIRYLSGKRANKKAPGTFSDEVMKERKRSLIITSVLIGVFVAIVIFSKAMDIVQTLMRRS